MGLGKYLKTGLIGAFALILAGTRLGPGASSHSPIFFGAPALMAGLEVSTEDEGTFTLATGMPKQQSPSETD